jgi:hypothetical protein
MQGAITGIGFNGGRSLWQRLVFYKGRRRPMGRNSAADRAF